MRLLWQWAALLAAGLLTVRGRVQQIDITGLVGNAIKLPCEIDEDKCGEVHNIQWYRGDGDTRVFIYSELANVDTSENMLQGRGYFEYNKGSSLTGLEIRDLRPTDESLYKCELTYLEVRDNCAVIQFVNLTTLAKPESIRILLEDGTEASPGSVIGPFEEDSQLTLKCESAGGKPAASVTWWNDTVNMGGTSRTDPSGDGTAVGTNVLRVPLSRHDLASSFECQSVNPAVRHPLRSRVYIDLYVRPLSVELGGLKTAVLEGTKVTLTCLVRGARPAANITWIGWLETTRSKTSVHAQPDGTANTVSTVTLTAGRAAHLRTVTCEASNQVIRVKAEPPLRASVTIHVLYAPVATVSPSKTAANETEDVLLFCRHDANPANLTAVTWYKDGSRLHLSDRNKFGGGTLENPSLFIKNTSRHDAGRYRCEVANGIGSGIANNEAIVHVQFPPEVSLTVTPANVTEADRTDVTFRCDVTAGDPAALLAVRWYQDGELLRGLPLCGRPVLASVSGRVSGTPCVDGADRMTLLGAGRANMANYTCSGLNRAGWGPLSKKKVLLVHYPPQQAILVHEPAVVLKGMMMTLTCQVDDPGYPPANKYLWMRGSHVVTDIRSRQWRVNAASLEEDDRFSCVAINSVGSSSEGTSLVDVLAKPQFIERLPLYLGALMNSSSISVTCRVECSPLCDLQWLKNDMIIKNSPHYSIKTSTLVPDPRTNDLESIVSTLTWNMSAWPGQMLDRVKDNANYTCRSTANVVGPGVSSTTFFTVEYPPQNVTVSPAVVDVLESSVPTTVRCTSSAFPDAHYIWTRGDEVIQTGDRLRLDLLDGVWRHRAGQFVCHARNKHGALTAHVHVRVMYKPECAIRQTEEDGEYLLLCEVDAVPDDVTFTWRFDNETLTEHIRTDGTISTLTVRPGSRDFGTYSCHVNNTVGAGIPCEIDVAGVSDWQLTLDQVSVIMVVTTVTATAVIAAVVCVVLYLICRRRHAKDRYDDPDPMLERDASRGASAGQGVQTVHKWPIRPGVHVHVTSVQSLSKLSDLGMPGWAATSAENTASDSSTKSSTNGSGCSSSEVRPIYESLAMHRTPSKLSRLGSHRDETPPVETQTGETGSDGAPSRPTDSVQSRPSSELSHNGSSGYGSSHSQEAAVSGPVRAQGGRQYGSTRSQRVETEKPGQQLLPIPQSPDLPEMPVTHDKTTQSEANNNDCERPVPPQRGPAAKPPYHNLSRARRARTRQRQNLTDSQLAAARQLEARKQVDAQNKGSHQPSELLCGASEQTPPGPRTLASRGFYTCGPPASRLCHADVAPPIPDSRAISRRSLASQHGRPRNGDAGTPDAPGTPVHAGCGGQGGAPGCGAPSRVQKDYVPSEYAVLQISGASHEIDV